MNLLQLLPMIEKYGRIKRKDWINQYLVRGIDETAPLFLCNLDCLVIKEHVFCYEELIADDWEILD